MKSVALYVAVVVLVFKEGGVKVITYFHLGAVSQPNTAKDVSVV